jgi:hypothetical protein
LLAGGGGGERWAAGVQDPLFGQGQFTAVLGEDMEPVPLEFQDHSAQDSFLFKEFD